MDLQQAIGIVFRDGSLLERALVHTSFCNENPAAGESNERLEFLGDAILGFVVAEKLYRDFPSLSEGEMTGLRSSLVRQETLAAAAASIGLGGYLYLGKGEEASGGRKKPANLASGLEAVIAAVFLDRGLEFAREFILRLMGDELGGVVAQGTQTNYKSRLQELLQSRQKSVPVYRTVEESGPVHDRQFAIEVLVDERVMGRGMGKTKKMAEMEAARQALERITPGFTG